VITPIFLMSLPRSGSTLVQRVLASHPQVASVNEPWLLLPLLASLNPRGALAEYDHQLTVRAIGDFCSNLPHGESDYLEELTGAVTRLYEKAAPPGARYFLDKTPRYHLYVEQIMALFPEAKIIFLWRNPLAVAASLIETWGGGRWNIYRFGVDLNAGLDNLVAAMGKHRERVHRINYEDLLERPEESWTELFDHLDLRFSADLLQQFTSVLFRGSMGDRTGSKRYVSLDREPLNKWKGTFANPLRKAWARRYLSRIGEDRLASMGYELNRLLDELESCENEWDDILADLVRMPAGHCYGLLETYLLSGRSLWSGRADRA
jgi:hypothetical protein